MQPTLDGARMAIRAPSSQPTISCMALSLQLGCLVAPLADVAPLLFLLHAVVPGTASDAAPVLRLRGVAVGVAMLCLREVVVGDALEVVAGEAASAAATLRLREVAS